MYSLKATKDKLLHKTVEYIKSSKIYINDFFFKCPFCEQQVKFEASISKDGSFKCQSCNKVGDVFALFEKVEKDIPEEEMILILAERLNIYAELSKTHLDMIDAKTLAEMELVPIKSIVSGIISQGLNILAGSPKIGKSFLVLWICLQVANGETVWDCDTIKGTTLYLSLEDNLRRLQDRLYKISDNPPANMFFVTRANKIKGELDIQIENFISENKDTSLIVLDTFQKIRENAKDFGNIYANDYDDMCYLKTIADKYDIAILIVHHTRKMTDSDPFNMISGSTGISGAADTMISLVKDNRMEGSATLQITGRDEADKKLALKFNQESFVWDILSSDAEEYSKQIEIDNNPVIKAISDLVSNKNNWQGTATELMEDLKHYSNDLPDIANKLSRELSQYQYELNKRGISYSKKASNGKRTITLQKIQS